MIVKNNFIVYWYIITSKILYNYVLLVIMLYNNNKLYTFTTKKVLVHTLALWSRKNYSNIAAIPLKMDHAGAAAGPTTEK